jgi:hypothetical protein
MRRCSTSALPRRVTEEQARAFAATAAANVQREYPRHVAHLIQRHGEELAPRRLHPAFYGSYDWHSAVHMHWLLARVSPRRPEAAALLDRQLTPENIAAELAYFQAHPTFERPYGWAWLLELQAELLRVGNRRWSEAVAPLAADLAERLAKFVAGAPYPIRAGSHGNTAFACLLGLDYARTASDLALEEKIQEGARRWYQADSNAPIAYEPSLDDFLSPALIEAVLMQAVLPASQFRAWLDRFLPQGAGRLAEVPTVADREDAKQSHLDGLALSRAWCLKRLGYAAEAERLLAAALPHATAGAYVGTHWLASFAALALGDTP